jgi:hypothetical protein
VAYGHYFTSLTDAQTLLQRSLLEGQALAANLARLATAAEQSGIPDEFGFDFTGYAESLRQHPFEDAHRDE